MWCPQVATWLKSCCQKMWFSFIINRCILLLGEITWSKIEWKVIPLFMSGLKTKRDHTKSKATAIYWTLSATPLKFKLQFQTVGFRASCTPNNCSRKDLFVSFSLRFYIKWTISTKRQKREADIVTKRNEKQGSLWVATEDFGRSVLLLIVWNGQKKAPRTKRQHYVTVDFFGKCYKMPEEYTQWYVVLLY